MLFSWDIGFAALADTSALDEQLDEPTLHSRSRCKQHWWQTGKQRCAYDAAADGSYDNGQLEQIGCAAQKKAHSKQRLGRPRGFKQSGKVPKSDKVHRKPQGPLWFFLGARSCHMRALGKLVQHLSMVPKSLQAASP